MQQTPIRDAASVVLWREGPHGPEILMGERGAAAPFMPRKIVFPGGGLDAADHEAGVSDIPARCRLRLGPKADALLACARRELSEEAGLRLTRPQDLRFIFRAITPASAPRRYDARFFLAPARALAPESRAPDGELLALTWYPLAQARGLDLPFVTALVLAETGALLGGAPADAQKRGVPFFDTRGPRAKITWLA